MLAAFLFLFCLMCSYCVSNYASYNWLIRPSYGDRQSIFISFLSLCDYFSLFFQSCITLRNLFMCVRYYNPSLRRSFRISISSLVTIYNFSCHISAKVDEDLSVSRGITYIYFSIARPRHPGVSKVFRRKGLHVNSASIQWNFHVLICQTTNRNTFSNMSLPSTSGVSGVGLLKYAFIHLFFTRLLSFLSMYFHLESKFQAIKTE